MKYKNLLFLTLLLSQTVPVWGMMDEEKISSAPYLKIKEILPTDTVEHLHNTIQAPNSDYPMDLTRADRGKVKTSIDHKEIIGIEMEKNDQYFANMLNHAELDCPLELKVHVLSCLDQWDLLRAGGISKEWRNAAEIVWKLKPPLELSNKTLNQMNYKIFTQGPFSSLIVRSIELEIEEPGKVGQLPEGLYQLFSVQDGANEGIEKWQRLGEEPNFGEILNKAKQQVYEICRITGRTRIETYQICGREMETPFSWIWPMIFPTMRHSYTTSILVHFPNLWKISKQYLPNLHKTVSLPDLWSVPLEYQAFRGSALNGNPNHDLNTNGLETPPAQTVLNRDNVLPLYEEYYQQTIMNPLTVDFVKPLKISQLSSILSHGESVMKLKQ